MIKVGMLSLGKDGHSIGIQSETLDLSRGNYALYIEDPDEEPTPLEVKVTSLANDLQDAIDASKDEWQKFILRRALKTVDELRTIEVDA